MVVVDKDTGQWQEEENEKKRKGTQDKIEVTCVRVGAGALPPLRNLWSERKKGTEKTRERPTIITFCIDCFSPTIYSNNQFLDLFQPMIFSIIQCFDLGFNKMDSIFFPTTPQFHYSLSFQIGKKLRVGIYLGTTYFAETKIFLLKVLQIKIKIS